MHDSPHTSALYAEERKTLVFGRTVSVYSEPMLSKNEIARIVDYCAEEVRRQGDTPLHVGYMVNAWLDALLWQKEGRHLNTDLVLALAAVIEPEENEDGYRGGQVTVGNRVPPRAEEVERLMERWSENLSEMSALEAYLEFEHIHPFWDGNGRTGKIILNWLNGTLLEPIFPPNDIFGYPIANP